MPPHSTIHTTIASLTTGPPLVIVIIGGTSGIGSYIAKAFASVYRNSKSKLRVYIVGRNASRAEALLAEVRSTSPGSEWRFMRAHDLALMSDVDAICAQIKKHEEEQPLNGGEPRIDMLYMTQAESPLAPSPPTKEGLDTQVSLLYYSRIRFILGLTPLLLRSQNPTGAHVISVFAGTIEDSISPSALPIGPPTPEKHGVTSVRTHVSFMKTFMFEALAEEHAGKIAFVHVYPGLVDGPTFLSKVNPLWFRVLWRVAKVFMAWYMTSPTVCGEVMVFLCTGRYPARGVDVGGKTVVDVAFSSTRERGGGAYAVGQRGDEKKQVSYAKLRKSDTRDRVWKHTMGVLESVLGMRE
ncbi:hypothetical protein J4E91_005093 [Alternaria rosae]|nr:hypothetical protein J4E91_005093 [Alternaria rosae]